MADIELVIKIPEDEYKICLSHRESIENMIRVHKCFSLEYAVVRGTPLPKGHGILKDEKELYELLNEERDDNFVLKVDAIVQRVKPIIEADKGREDKE